MYIRKIGSERKGIPRTNTDDFNLFLHIESLHASCETDQCCFARAIQWDWVITDESTSRCDDQYDSSLILTQRCANGDSGQFDRMQVDVQNPIRIGVVVSPEACLRLRQLYQPSMEGSYPCSQT